MKYHKYPRTPHHPLSETIFSDDKIMDAVTLSKIYGKHGVATIKMDGENTTIYPNGYTHARSIDSSKSFPYQAFIKRFAANISYKIPLNHRLCGENMTTTHKVHYAENIPVFLGFSAWDEERCLSWDETLELYEAIGVEPVEEIWSGIITEDTVKEIWSSFDKENNEGIVIRLAESFSVDSFEESVFKLVRKGFDCDVNQWNPIEPRYNNIK